MRQKKANAFIFQNSTNRNPSWSKTHLETVSCLICRSTKKKVLYENIYPRIVRCLSCGFIYTNPRLKEKYLAELYGQEYFSNKNSSVLGYNDYLADEKKIIKTFTKRLHDIEKMQKPGKLLDVGSATGFFMHVAQKHGWETEGVEISKYASSYAKKRFGLKVHTAPFEKVKLPKKSFDLITLWDTIEHVADPIRTLRKAHRLLKDNGMIVLSTPDVGSFPALLTKHRWVGYKLCDEHLSYFSYKSIDHLCSQSGFTIKKHHHLGKHVSFSLFADRVGLYSKTVGNILQFADKFIPKSFHFYISAFDIICIYATKNTHSSNAAGK